MKEISFNEAIKRLEMMERGYPDYENFEPWHCNIGLIMNENQESNNKCIHPTQGENKMIRINCIHYGDFCHCNHPEMKKVLWIFKRECIEMPSMTNKCFLKIEHPKPKIGPPPPPRKR